MKRHRLKVELILEGPILTQSSAAAAPGIDAAVARNADGKVMLPYSLVKGKIVDAFRELPTDVAKVRSWLGIRSVDGEYDPERGRLSFTDFVSNTPERKTDDHDGIIERIQINNDTGAVDRGMLVMIEAPYGYGEPVTFVGHIDFIADDPEAKQIKVEIEKACNLVSSYGAMRTIGFGRRKKVTLSFTNAAPTATGTLPNSPFLPVRYKLDRPFCVVGRKHSGNHFDSLEHLPGQVLKGAVARLILELNGRSEKFIDTQKSYTHFSTVCQYFDKIRFGEAKPMREAATERPIEPPLSVVVVPGGTHNFEDVALSDKAKLFPTKKGLLAAPAFQPDWKDADYGTVRGAFGWSQLETERRVRTAIDPDKWKAKDNELFSYGLVRTQGFVWEGTIGLHDIPQPEQGLVRDDLVKLLAEGLPNIGKTRAKADIEWLKVRTPAKVPSQPSTNGTHVITLQTDCLLTNPETLKTKSLHDAYSEFWDELSGGSLKLLHFFARQSLHGGFVSRRVNKQNYKPFLLTDRGSTFVLEVVESVRATSFLSDLQEQPLPSVSWVPKDWKECPFLPHVGYGEVVVDLDCHTARKPNESA